MGIKRKPLKNLDCEPQAESAFLAPVILGLCIAETNRNCQRNSLIRRIQKRTFSIFVVRASI